MTISATVITDSISPQGKRMRTWQVNCHRFILPEVNTHRMLSRNWASSRAIPTIKLIGMVQTNPATPIHWGKNQPGMQAHAELDYDSREQAMAHWWEAAQDAVKHANWLNQVGAHKQIVNRVLEPYLWVRGVISSTDMENFYALRRHADAQPEIKALADAMWEAEQASTPKLLQPGEWHLPYITNQDAEDAYWFCKRGRITRDEPAPWEIRDVLLKVSVARCARVSYATHAGKISSIEEDVALYARLLERTPLHASPAEHQATPDTMIDTGCFGVHGYEHENQHGNLRGWRQHRKLLPGECFPG